MGKIVAIAGGDLKSTTSLNKYAVSLTHKERPDLLFMPTASWDSEGYICNIEKYFGDLNCNVKVLSLLKKEYKDFEIKNMILSSDIIYVGGGDTVRMMEKWNVFHVDDYMKQAYRKGIVLTGISAGAICWFNFGNSDSDSFIHKGSCSFIRAYGLNIIPAAFCPHYNEKGRDSFDEMMSGEKIPGFAMENNTAFVEEDSVYQIKKSDCNAHAYRIEYSNGIKLKEEIKENQTIAL